MNSSSQPSEREQRLQRERELDAQSLPERARRWHAHTVVADVVCAKCSRHFRTTKHGFETHECVP